MRHIFLILLLFAPNCAKMMYGQTRAIDSLTNLVKSARQDTQQVRLLIALADAYSANLKMAQALETAKTARSLAESLGFESGRAYAIDRQAGAYSIKMRIDSALALYQSILPYAEQKKDNQLVLSVLIGIGTNTMKKGNIDVARSYLYRALSLARKSGFLKYEAMAIYRIGGTYMGEERYQEAIDTLVIAADLIKKSGNQRMYTEACRNISDCYVYLDIKDKSLEWGKLFLQAGQVLRDSESISMANLSIGTIFINAKQADSAEIYTLRAYHFIENNHKKFNKTQLYYNLATINGLKNDYTTQLKWLLKAYEMERNLMGNVGEHLVYGMNLRGACFLKLGRITEAQQCFSDAAQQATRLTNKADAYYGLYQVAERLHQPQNALNFYKRFVETRDSMFNEENTKKLTQIEMNHEFAKKQVVIKAEQEMELTLRDAENKQQKWIFALLFLGLLGTAGFVFYNYRQRQQRRRTELELANLRAQINPHFIFNCLNSIYRYTKERDTVTAAKYLQKFSSLLRLVLENSRTEKITLARDLDALQLYVDIESLRFKEKLQYALEIDPEIDTTFVQIPGMLIQPHVENAIWHGLMHRETGGQIKVKITQPQEALLRIEVEDNGVGRAAAAEAESKSALTKKSLGQKITAERLKGTGKLAFSETIDLIDAQGNAMGTRVVMEIPL